MEDSDDDDSILSPKQYKLIIKIVRNACGYFGLYWICGELDDHL